MTQVPSTGWKSRDDTTREQGVGLTLSRFLVSRPASMRKPLSAAGAYKPEASVKTADSYSRFILIWLRRIFRPFSPWRTARREVIEYFRKALEESSGKIIIYLFICPLTFPQARSNHNRNSK